MRNRLFSSVMMLVLLLGTVVPVAAQSPPDAPETSDEEVLVSGVRPGPPLWRVRKGDNTLYMLAIVNPMPKGLEWRSREVESVLDRATAFVPPTVSVGFDLGKIGYFKAAKMYLEFRRLRDNPDDRPLSDVVPADLYARFSELHTRYAPKERALLKRRPVFAVYELWDAAVARSKLSKSDVVGDAVEKMAGERQLKFLSPSVTSDDPRASLDEFARTPPETEIPCMRSVLARFDTDLALARERAIAWAEGDVDALRAGAKRSSLDACLEGFADTMQVAGKMRDARWDRLVEAVEDHAVSLAVVEEVDEP